MKAKLLGALIGLARVTDGNEHLISASSTGVLRQGLLAAASENREEMALALEAVTEQKKQMVPGCFQCANPCGKNDAFDLSLLERDPARELKTELLQQLRPDLEARLLYTALIAVGISGIDPSILKNLLEKAKENAI